MKLSPSSPDGGVSRRNFLQLGVGASAAAMLQQLFPARAAADTRRKLGVIFVWLDGGISQIDSFDHKPSAPTEIRGDPSKKWPTGIQTKTRDAIFASWFEGMAARSDKYALIRSMRATSFGVHTTAYDEALQDRDKGHLMVRMGKGSRVVPYALMDSLYDTNFAEERRCFEVAKSLPFDWEEQKKSYVMRADLTRPERHDERNALLEQMNRISPTSRPIQEWDDKVRLANRLLSNSIRETEADPRLVERYGRNRIGMGILSARNAVASGLSTVAVVRTGPWDIHSNLPNRMEDQSRQLDRAVSALLDDMGREWEGLFVMRGEFGRTPTVNRDGGRDHHPLHSAIIAHDNVVAGAYGSTCRDCRRVTADEVRNDALAATVMELATGHSEAADPVIAKLLKRRFTQR